MLWLERARRVACLAVQGARDVHTSRKAGLNLDVEHVLPKGPISAAGIVEHAASASK
jgi:hypothetical protein